MARIGAPQFNVGILAHVDAGKTTLTEQLLFQGGAIREMGRVDHGTAHSDSLPIEQQRGISIRSAAQVLQWQGQWIGLIDTPGHVDFASEVERSLQALDSVILVVSAVEGVQSHTRALWRAVEAMKLPCLILINKIDRTGARPSEVLEELRQELTAIPVPMQRVGQDASGQWQVGDLWRGDPSSSYDAQAPLLEALAEVSEEAMVRYLEEEALPVTELLGHLRQNTSCGRVVPVFFGAALHGVGVTELLDGMIAVVGTNEADVPEDADPSGIVFQIDHHSKQGRRAFVRLFHGHLEVRDSISVDGGDSAKITGIERLQPMQYPPEARLEAGQLGIVHGLGQAQVGSALGSGKGIRPPCSIGQPLLRVQVLPHTAEEFNALAEALVQLEAEDPALRLEWWKDERELFISMMGSIQQEILTALLQERFSLRVSFGTPGIIYRERLAAPAEGYVSYTMPKPCWAKLRFRMEPQPPGTGYSFSSTVSYDVLPFRYQKQAAAAIPKTLEQGLLGWPVLDLKVTLIDGEYHLEHTKAPDFTVAAPMAIMDGLQNGGVELLEPVEEVMIEAPEELTSRILNDISSMRGRFEAPTMLQGRVTIRSFVPAAEFLDYPVTLASLSGGRAMISKSFHGYELAPPEIRVERKRQGVNPLDRSRWILSVRNAL